MDDVGGRTLRGRFKARVAKVHHLMDAARKLSGARRTARLQRARRVLGSFISALHRANEKGKIVYEVSERLLRFAAAAQSNLTPLIQ